MVDKRYVRCCFEKKVQINNITKNRPPISGLPFDMCCNTCAQRFSPEGYRLDNNSIYCWSFQEVTFERRANYG